MPNPGQFAFIVIAFLMAVIGGVAGSLINLGIYRLGLFTYLISPWTKAPEGCPARSWLDRVPIFGWLRLRRESIVFGSRFWIRPLFIEIGCALGLTAMFVFYWTGGLIGGTEQVTKPDEAVIQSWIGTWLIFHSILFGLLVIATFIDFDEQTIPDWITIPGTLFALSMSVLFPNSRLPTVSTGLAGNEIESLHYQSPLDLTHWHDSLFGLMSGIGVVTIWCLALLPTLWTWRKGPFNAIRFFLATLWPSPRRTVSAARVRDRGATTYHWMVAILLLVVAPLIFAVWQSKGSSWDALFGSLMGMAFGGGLTWAVRIIAGKTLGVEAMGFGDVTLMAMIGAALGWQPALLVFALAPFASIVVAVAILISTGEQKIAFGPYLCIATAVVVIGWYSIWNEWAAQGIFSLGPILLVIIAVALCLMGVMLFLWSCIKARVHESK